MYDQVTVQCQECLSNNQLQIMSYQVKSQMERRLWLNILSKSFDENGNDLKGFKEKFGGDPQGPQSLGSI